MKFSFGILMMMIFFTAAAGNVELRPVSATGGAVYKFQQGALIIDFPAYDVKLNNTHPTVNLPLNADCSAYDGVDVDLRLSGGLSSSLSINFRDNTGKQCFDVCPVADGIRTTMRFKFNPSRKMDKKNMKFLRIYLSRPAFAAQFTIYGIKLFSAAEERKKVLAPIARRLGMTEELNKQTCLEEYEKFTSLLRKKQIASLVAATPDKSFPCGVSFITPLDRPLPFYDVLPDGIAHKGSLALAGNEAENLHLITVSSKAVKSISAAVSGLPLSMQCSIHPAGAVRTKATNAPGAHVGWHFDPVLKYTSTAENLAPEQLQLWGLQVKSGATPAGIYQGKVTFTSDGKSFTLPFDVKVHNFSLPKTKTLRTATAVYSSKLMGKLKPEFEKWLLENYHLNNFSIYSESGAYGDPVLPSIADYTDAVKRGANFLPILYLKLPRQAHHTHKKIAPAQSKQLWERMTPAEKAHYPQEWKNKYIEILKQRIPELKKAGLWKYAYCYAFDEATPSEWPAIIELVKELKKHFPDLKIISTLTDNSYGLRTDLAGHIDGWIPTVNQYSFERAEKARAKGREVWYYTAGLTVDSTPLSFIRTQLGERAFASKVEGWLIWTVSRWYNNPTPLISNNPLTHWNPESFPGSNGGGSYFCLGKDNTFLPTLRSEAMRDGIEDYEYFTLLKALALKRNAADPLRLEAEKLFKGCTMTGKITPAKLFENRARAAALIERMK